MHQRRSGVTDVMIDDHRCYITGPAC
jgi:hypothetical protein